MPSTLWSHTRCLFRLALPLAGLALLVTGCADKDRRGPVNLTSTGAQFPKQLGVEKQYERYTVLFPTDSAEISPAERRQLLSFLASAGVERGAVVRLGGHADERASDRYNLDLSARRLEAVRATLEAAGYRRVEVVSTAYGERSPAVSGTGPEVWRQNRRVEVLVERTVAVLPACPDWSEHSGTDFANMPFSNLGCGVRTNQGLMIADPRDLERGRQLGPADGVKAAGAIDRYRRGEETELVEEGFE